MIAAWRRPAPLTRSALVVGLLGAGLLSACSDDDGGDIAAFCTAVADRDRFEAVFDQIDPSDVDGALAAFREASTLQSELREVAPSAVHADLDAVANFIDDLVAGLEDAEPPGLGTPRRPDVYDQLRPRFEEVEAAGDRLESYVAANCTGPG